MSYVCSQMKLAHTYTRRERPFECMLGRERERERERERALTDRKDVSGSRCDDSVAKKRKSSDFLTKHL